MDQFTMIEALAALAHDTRLKVFRLLAPLCPDGLPSGEIAARLNVPATTMSAHLAVLARAGLVRAERDSRLVRYALDPAAVRQLLHALAADCCGGRPELCGPLSAAPTNACTPKVPENV
jgi:ArsR family transcriptional regulator, arsenate/arsenite/antimonite-responsive transcriptional repressor